ncbi:hypothetical protein AFLA_013313 [Aspergillus flavus NRRL3357]|nr:hypothetical protein AFLA_013313 [Aspergillus flavus NRRL3357]
MEEPTYDPSRPMPAINIVYQYKLTHTPDKSIVGLRPMSAVLIATMVLDTEALERDGMDALIQIDEEYRK